MTCQYDGARFYGWQLQNNRRTVQGELEHALAKLNQGKRVPVTGAGRTDTGVHAMGMVAHFDLDTTLRDSELKAAINGNSGQDILITALEQVDDVFHARFSAQKRTYRYQIYPNGPLFYRSVAWLTESPDISLLNRLAEAIIGDHDFLSFGKYNPDLEHTRCTIFQSMWKNHQDLLIFTVTGNRFLHHMVRYLVGSMMAVSREQMKEAEFMDLLHHPRKDVQIYKAPPQGLILEQVHYAE